MKLDHTGIHASRCEHPSSALEKAFAEQWHDENDVGKKWVGTTRILDALLRADVPDRNVFSPLGDSRPYHFGEPPTQRDATVAATVIQWLGSNVGRSFIEEALKRAGYKGHFTRDLDSIGVAQAVKHKENCDAITSPALFAKPCSCGAARAMREDPRRLRCDKCGDTSRLFGPVGLDEEHDGCGGHYHIHLV